jgi:hypothetical protein
MGQNSCFGSAPALIALVIPAQADSFAHRVVSAESLTCFSGDHCKQNGGIDVDIKNPGCLNEGGRGVR